MQRTLLVTSPLMHGQDVKDCQWLLHAKGYHVRVDGQFGVNTGATVAHWKRDFGYPDKECVASWGEPAYLFATGRAKQPTKFKLRAAARRRAAALLAHSRKGRIERVVNLALSELGTREWPSGSNRVKYDLWYGFVGPWCAAFVSWCCAHVSPSVRFKYSYCPAIVSDGRNRRNGLSVAPGPAEGDLTELVLALFDWPGESPGLADHVGITLPESWLRKHHSALLAHGIREYGNLGQGDFWTVEGNTAVGNDSNGGEVMLRKRNRSSVEQFVRVL